MLTDGNLPAEVMITQIDTVSIELGLLCGGVFINSLSKTLKLLKDRPCSLCLILVPKYY